MNTRLSYFLDGSLTAARYKPRRVPCKFGDASVGGLPYRVFCSDYRCSHSTHLPADRWPDSMRPSDIEPQFICKACGKRGADVTLLFQSAKMGSVRRRSTFTTATASFRRYFIQDVIPPLSHCRTATKLLQNKSARRSRDHVPAARNVGTVS